MKNVSSFLKQILGFPVESKNASQFVVNGLWLLRVLTFSFGLFQIFFGDTAVGIAIIVCVIFLVSPAIFTKNRLTNIPLEIEFFLFIAVVAQYILGEAQGFYINVPFYDKFMHFALPFLIGFMGFVVSYTMYFSGRLKLSIGAMLVFTVLTTLGIGAFWEIIEYSSDQFLLPHFPLWHHFQGSATEDALHDTMNDLILDTFGGIVGSLTASKYLIAETFKNRRVQEVIQELKSQLFKRKRDILTK